MAVIAVLTVSDGRASVHESVEPFALGVQERIVAALAGRGHDVRAASEAICSNEHAVRLARAAAAGRPDVAILNLPVWAFPHFSVLAANELDAPVVLFGNVDPQYPGMVGMLAAGGALDQLGRVHGRVWGDVGDDAVLARLERYAAAGRAVRRLKGSTFGRIGGRPMGMYTAVSSSDQWMNQFGVDVEEIDQYELARRAELVDPARGRAGREWLERYTAGVHYDGRGLTPEILERQVRAYHAMREIIDEHRLDFAGIKAQPELTDHFCTMDVAEAFLNDPYDWEGAKAPFVCSTEADMDAALTMQILTCLSDTPALFADVRHYEAELDIWDLCNSGQHATWFAARSDEPAENLRHVHLYPQSFYFPAGGAAVHHVAAPGAMTFARMTRLDGRYRMQVLRGRLEELDGPIAERLMRASSYEWPHAFAHLDAAAEEILARYGSNHIHAVPGEHVAALAEVCRFLDVDFDPIGSVG
jgi:L-fucose/D-arabinose isomerase